MCRAAAQGAVTATWAAVPRRARRARAAPAGPGAINKHTAAQTG